MTGRQMFVRSALTISLPFVLIFVYFEELWRGFRSSFRFAWLVVRDNCESYRLLMKQEDFKEGENHD